ncbi:unnamed protein product [Nesidiocoris tenuis]|uniref:Uncharacterized protein n=1 Tax=Nesidiocoris tenuis TaxID=355587 RepID=A0A6H5GGW2_9HEMI|nr:unnamed protein product [Nesidiocoris tenuis]
MGIFVYREYEYEYIHLIRISEYEYEYIHLSCISSIPFLVIVSHPTNQVLGVSNPSHGLAQCWVIEIFFGRKAPLSCPLALLWPISAVNGSIGIVLKSRIGTELQKKLFLIHIYSESLPEQVSVCPGRISQGPDRNGARSYLEHYPVQSNATMSLRRSLPVGRGCRPRRRPLLFAAMEKSTGPRAAASGHRRRARACAHGAAELRDDRAQEEFSVAQARQHDRARQFVRVRLPAARCATSASSGQGSRNVGDLQTSVVLISQQ